MKMGMRDILLCEIDIIIQQQIWISNYISVLEDRRQRLIEFIQTSEELEMSKHARENLIDNVENMEIKLVTQKDCKAKNQRVREKRKCRYDNRGYCKHLNNCTYYHGKQICDQFLTDGKCDAGKSCQSRHPRDCRYWMKDDEGCKHEESCRYLHRQGKRKHKDTKERISKDANTVKDINEVSGEANDCDQRKNEQEDMVMDMVMQTETSKDDTIKELKEVESNLKVENLSLKKQIQRLENIATNMHKEINMLKSRRS